MSENTTLTGKEEFIAQCVAGGKTRAECEKVWDEGHGEKTLDNSTLKRENEMLKVENRQLKDALRESTDIIKAFNNERDAVIEARKYEIALELEKNSDGKLKHSELMQQPLNSLMDIKKGADAARPKDFVSVSQLLTQDNKPKKPQLTVGEWDPITKEYRGGV